MLFYTTVVTDYTFDYNPPVDHRDDTDLWVEMAQNSAENTQNHGVYTTVKRVGIRNEVRKSLILSHFSRFKVQNDTILIL